MRRLVLKRVESRVGQIYRVPLVVLGVDERRSSTAASSAQRLMTGARRAELGDRGVGRRVGGARRQRQRGRGAVRGAREVAAARRRTADERRRHVDAALPTAHLRAQQRRRLGAAVGAELAGVVAAVARRPATVGGRCASSRSHADVLGGRGRAELTPVGQRRRDVSTARRQERRRRAEEPRRG